MNPKFSIVIPNLHSPIIDQVLHAIRQQRYPLAEVEVIVVGLDKYNLVKDDDLVSFISTEQPTPPAKATNIGLQHARGEIICLLDADCLVEPDWLEALDHHFSDPEVYVVAGTFDFPTDDFWTIADSLAHYSEVLGRQKMRLPEAPSQNFALRRVVIEQVGALDDRFPRPGGEDTEFTRRLSDAGFDIWFAPNVKVFHQVKRPSLALFCERSFRFGRYSVWGLPDEAWKQKRPLYLSHWALALLTSPIMPPYFAFLTFWQNPHLLRFWYTFPALVLSRFVWRLGVAKSLWRPEIEEIAHFF